MSYKSKNKRKAIFRSLRPEFFIMIAIILCVCVQLTLDNFLSSEGALVLNRNGYFAVITDKDLAKEIIDKGDAIGTFNPRTCRMINIRDENGRTTWEMLFTESALQDHEEGNYTYIPDEMLTQDQGTFDLKTADGEGARISFKWYTAQDGERYLIAFSSSILKEKKHSQRIALSYVIITLCFVMLCNVLYWQIHGITNRYKKLMLQDIRNTTL